MTDSSAEVNGRHECPWAGIVVCAGCCQGCCQTYGINVHVSMIARLFGGAARSVVVSIAGTIVALAA